MSLTKVSYSMITGAGSPRVLTLANAIPANTAGNSWVVVGNLYYQVP